MSKATNDIARFVNKLKKTVDQSFDRVRLQFVGEFAMNLIQKRTRLGYGVPSPFSNKEKLANLSDRYIDQRAKESLDSTTRPKKSNLTRTGQMLRSLSVSVVGRKVVIAPSGTRDDGLTNLQVAQYAHDGSANRPKRVFNNLSRLEYNQMLRAYRKSFGDLINKSFKGRLIR